MGQLILSIGPLNSVRNFDNAAGNIIFSNYIAAFDGPVDGSNQEKLDWFVAHLAAHVQAIHAGYVRRQAMETATADANAGLVEW